jgi:hypothetical protein
MLKPTRFSIQLGGVTGGLRFNFATIFRTMPGRRTFVTMGDVSANEHTVTGRLDQERHMLSGRLATAACGAAKAKAGGRGSF